MSKSRYTSDDSVNLFSAEEIDEELLAPTPVRVLGMDFPSDDARREYFREELRKRLPELRKIEGFPIGEDDDIINLSDPPYYTACPNPWLNDFIAEWEADKKRLESEGKRSRNFRVIEPYAADVSEGKNNPIYMAHAYHTKVPHTAIMKYILHYSQPGDIVFDGFCGTGMTGVAAQLCGDHSSVSNLDIPKASLGVRHAICSDLSPIASLIAASYNNKFDPHRFEIEANQVLAQVESELGWMYKTQVGNVPADINYTIWSDVYACPTCGKELTLWNETVDLNGNKIQDEFYCPSCGSKCTKKNMQKVRETVFDSILGTVVTIAKKVPVRINYICNKKRGEQDITEFDLALLERIQGLDTSRLRTSDIPHGDEISRNEKDGISHIHHFYSLRNFIYLSRVNELVRGNVALQAWFTSVLLNVSKMYKFRLDRKGSMLYGTFFIPSFNVEFNPHRALKGKIRDFAQTNYVTRANSLVSINSATNLPNLADNSVDYIFTDPPFGSNLMYSELSSIWEGWLNLKTNNSTEAVISNTQQKDGLEYFNLMVDALKEYYRVLKSGKWMTVEFSNTSASVWNFIQTALQNSGFIIVNVAALDKKQGSFKAVTTTTAVKQDLVITCFKPKDGLIGPIEDAADLNRSVVGFIEELLLHLPIHVRKDNSTTAVVERSPKILYDRLISYFVTHGMNIPMDAGEFQQMLKDMFIERDGMFFTASQAVQYEEQRAKTQEFVPMTLFIASEADGIAWLKRNLDTPKTYQEIQPDWMKDMVAPKKGDTIPELRDILEENFIEDEEGKWRVPNAEKAADLEILRNRRMLKEFNLYLEQARKPRAKRMKDVRLEVLRYGFKEMYKAKDYQAIIDVADHIPESLVQEDEQLLQYYDIASMKV